MQLPSRTGAVPITFSVAQPLSVLNPQRIARNLMRRSMLTLGTVFGDLHDSWQGLAPSGNADFGAISRDFERKILRPRKFSKISVRNSLRIARNLPRRI